mmetsp:Transcript_12478/g.27624  ORF Transcript_12478/g.27624 Transcript_12478/m.27624 type:complete len:223 (-) Transcript_12478:133-801(-)
MAAPHQLPVAPPAHVPRGRGRGHGGRGGCGHQSWPVCSPDGHLQAVQLVASAAPTLPDQQLPASSDRSPPSPGADLVHQSPECTWHRSAQGTTGSCPTPFHQRPTARGSRRHPEIAPQHHKRRARILASADAGVASGWRRSWASHAPRCRPGTLGSHRRHHRPAPWRVPRYSAADVPTRRCKWNWPTSRSTRLQHMSLDQGIQCHASPRPLSDDPWTPITSP